MAISAPFIRRPVATVLLAVGVLLAGAAAYRQLPIASLPAVDLPTIRVFASLPGADPNTVASSLAAPLERRLGEIADVTELTSNSSLGSTSVAVQFDLGRNIDAAARDVQAAINAAGGDLPKDLPAPPTYRKANPAAAPVLVLAMTADTLPLSEIYDYADTVVAEKLSQIAGVSEVIINGADKSAVRVQVDPALLASMNLSLEDVRAALSTVNADAPKGSLEGARQSYAIAADDQLFRARSYAEVIVGYRNGIPIRLGDIAHVIDGVANMLVAGWFNDRYAVIVYVFRQPGANIVETVDRLREALPQVAAWMPPAIKIAVLSDRTGTIRASIADVQLTLALTIGLVLLVMLLFLRRFWATAIPCLTIPVSLAGTFCTMWLLGYSLDNLSLMALIVCVGFVVDDAIVMIENIARHIEAGEAPLAAAFKGARQIGFTVVSMTVSLLAAFIPLLFMGGVIGRFFREFAVSLSSAVIVSAIVSLTLTPMMSGRLLSPERPQEERALFRALAAGFERLRGLYARALGWTLDHEHAWTALTLGIMAATVYLYFEVPKGFMPAQDIGIIRGLTEAPQDISYDAMSERQQSVTAIILGDPAVQSLGSFIGPYGLGMSTGELFINLKSKAERKVGVLEVIQRLRPKLGALTGITTYLQPVQDFGAGARVGKGFYQYTLRDFDLDELSHWSPLVLQRMRELPALRDVGSDRQAAGLQSTVDIDRDTAARLGVSPAAIDQTLYDAFGQRQVSTVYTPLNQYKVILEVDPKFRADPAAISHIYVKSSSGNLVPLSAFARLEPDLTPLSVAHQGQIPAVTISFNLAPDVAIGTATRAVDDAIAALKPPGSLRATFEGNARSFRAALATQPILISAAVAFVYIVLGILYESYIHPLTIISTLPSAGLGALLAMLLTGSELSLIAIIGIVLLIGIVKKNAIMMIDFALEAERTQGKSPREAILQACLIRFRPIMMTTMAALFGTLPLAIGTGSGSELRQPLGIAVVGGLLVSQVLTLFTTPVIYLQLGRLSARVKRRRPRSIAPSLGAE